ncbi:MAG: glucose-6-phosphate isomerase family protein [Candidatus Micrarchaeota archaeon]
MNIYEKPFRIEIDGTKLVVDGRTFVPAVRTFKDLLPVLMEEPDKDGEAYYMYREVYKVGSLRYDITLIPRWQLKSEFAKTYGHCHPIAEKTLTYPEVYQVLDGEAIFLLQKELRDGSFSVSTVEAKKGDVLLIPPNFCHTTVNPGAGPLLLANIVSDAFTPDYSFYKRNHGAAYYYTGEKIFRQNASYMITKNERVHVAEINLRYGFQCRDLLAEFYASPDKFAFLNKPSLLKLEGRDL